MKQTTKRIVSATVIIAGLLNATGAMASAVASNVNSYQLVELGTLSEAPLPYSAPRNASPSVGPDLTQAADASIHAVVHIRATINSSIKTIDVQDPFGDFFGNFFGNQGPGNRQRRQIQTPKQIGIGSGVIISSDGYIVTNNHVVDKSDELTVTLNDKREFKARLIGQDAATDLALIKIEGKNLPTLPIGDSDALKVGEWVLAVGNPLNLSSTVTAGIVSAKARNLGMSGDIESFIQTDAAINQGNSGGALVNTSGQLVGINAAIMSNTGSYTGYGFAIPTSIMKKVVSDLKEYGIVQRAVLGITGSDNTDELSKKEDLGIIHGVYIHEVTEDGAAANAGLKKKDVITAINDKAINSMAELQETIARFAPGEKIKISYYRDKKEKTLTLVLRNQQGNTKVVKTKNMEILGAAFRELPKDTKQQLSLSHGIEVTGLQDGKMKDSGIKKGFIIQKVNGQIINSVDDFESAFKEATQTPELVLFISGVYPSGKRTNYAVDLSEKSEKK